MKYITIYNTRYNRQFEAVVTTESWADYTRKYGVGRAEVELVIDYYRPKKRKNVTKGHSWAIAQFIRGSTIRPDIYGSIIIKRGQSKKAVLEKKHAEVVITSTRKAARIYRRARIHGF